MNNCLKYVSFLLFIISQSTFADEGIIAPKLIENLNSTKVKETASYSRLEGWVYMTYMVNEHGHPEHIDVIAHSENDKFISASTAYVENLRFEPAKFKGKNTSFGQTYLMRHRKSFIENSNAGITTYFQKRYNKIEQLINQGETDQSSQQLQELIETNTKNLTEQALASWLQSKHYYRMQDWTRYRDKVLEAFYLREHLPAELAIKATQNLLDWQIHKNLFSDALVTVYTLAELAGNNLDTSSLAQSIIDLNGMIEKPIIVINTHISHDRLWQHRLLKQKVSLTSVSGALDFVEIRCENGRLVKPMQGFQNLELPDELGSCVLFLGAASKSKVSIVEAGNLRI